MSGASDAIMSDATEAIMSDSTDDSKHEATEKRLSEFQVIFEAKDPEDPKNWPMWYRAWIMVTVAFSAWVIVLYSTSYTSAVPGLRAEFHVSTLTGFMGMTTYMLGLALGSLLAPPISELYGRRIVYLSSMCCWAIFIVPAASAQSMTAILVVRLIRYYTSPCS